MYCPQCGSQLSDGQGRCPSCGSPVGGPPPLPLPQAMPVKKSSSKMVWVIVGCAVIPVVIGFVGIIAAILIPNFLDALQLAKQKRAVNDLRSIGQVVETYRSEHGFAPNASTMDALATELGGAGAGLARVDPWKHPYRYGCWQVESTAGCDHYRIVSGGRDGRFEQDDLSAYQPGAVERTAYDRDLVFGDGAFLAAPGIAAPGR